MKFLLWLIVLGAFSYTTLFSISLWKEKIKPGAMIMMVFAIAILILPYFITLS